MFGDSTKGNIKD